MEKLIKDTLSGVVSNASAVNTNWRCHETSRRLKRLLTTSDKINTIKVIDGIVSYTGEAMRRILSRNIIDMEDGLWKDILLEGIDDNEEEISRSLHSWCKISTREGNFHASHYYQLNIGEDQSMDNLSIVIPDTEDNMKGITLIPTKKKPLMNGRLIFPSGSWFTPILLEKSSLT